MKRVAPRRSDDRASRHSAFARCRGIGILAAALLLSAPTARASAALEEIASGSSLDSEFVTTSQPLTAVSQDLYLASISSKRFEPVIAVNGLGLFWIPVAAQCSGRDTTGVSLWMARGVPSASGPVTAQLRDSANSAVISVARYSGAEAQDPLGALVSANSNGPAGACVDGIDSDAYSADLTATADGAVILGAAAIRQRSHTSGLGYIEIAEVHAASGGAGSGLASEERTLTTAGLVSVEGSLSGATDWAVIGLEIAPQSPAGTCGDALCNGAETCASCAQDCGACDPCVDVDGDLYGAFGSPSCTLAGADCDDGDPAVFPGAAETLCDGIDNNCNGLVDDDVDGDVDGVSLCSGDCDDGDPEVFPGRSEVCSDQVDNNCNQIVDCNEVSCWEGPVCEAPPVPALPGPWARLALGLALAIAVGSFLRRPRGRPPGR